jgi:hypothetical protein
MFVKEIQMDSVVDSKFVRNVQKLRKISYGFQLHPSLPKKSSFEEKNNNENGDARMQTKKLPLTEKKRGKSINSEKRQILFPINRNDPLEGKIYSLIF